MKKQNISNHIFSIGISFALVFAFLGVSSWNVRSVQAGTGTNIDIPASNIIPTLDGVCDPTEYSDAIQATVTVGTSNTFPVFMKHTADYAYFCFGNASGLPLPNGALPSVTVYVDPTNDGSIVGNDSNDFGVWMSYDATTPPFAHYWGTGNYQGADPGGWQAAKHQVLGSNPFWQVEFRISRQTMGGWNHPVGLALFYHWWQAPNDDYSWPANGIWAAPQLWANVTEATGKVDIGNSSVIPVVDGQCGSEYSDASYFSFPTSSGVATVYEKHSLTDMYICVTNLAVPAVAQQNLARAILYMNRAGIDGDTPGASDVALSITYNGTVQANTGDGSGFTGADPGGYSAAYFHFSGGWGAEYRINGAMIGNWFSRKIGLTVAEQDVNFSGDDYVWPVGYSYTIPNTWGVAHLIGLGNQIYLPSVTK